MNQPGLEGLILPIVVILLIWLGTRSRGNSATGSGPTLVLKTFSIYRAGSEGTYIRIVGRPAGLVSWLLTIMKFETTTTFTLVSDKLTYRGASLRGEHNIVFPLPSIESTSCGYSKPIGWAIIGILAILIGLVTLFNASDGVFLQIVGIIIGAIFIVNYFLSKKMYISVSSGQATVSMSFQKSVIENVPVTMEKALEAIDVLNYKVSESQMKL